MFAWTVVKKKTERGMKQLWLVTWAVQFFVHLLAEL